MTGVAGLTAETTMTKPPIATEWLTSPNGIIESYSLEVTVRDIPALKGVASRIRPTAPVAIPHLTGDSEDARVAAARTVCDLGFEPMLHFSARRIASLKAFEDFLIRAVTEARIRCCFVILACLAVAS